MVPLELILVFLMINVFMFFIVHGMKFRRFSNDDIKPIITEIFSELCFVTLLTGWALPSQGPPPILLALIVVTRLIWLLIKHRTELDKITSDVFHGLSSKLESAVLLICLLISFKYISKSIWAWFIPFAIISSFSLKEAFLISPTMKILTDETKQKEEREP